MCQIEMLNMIFCWCLKRNKTIGSFTVEFWNYLKLVSLFSLKPDLYKMYNRKTGNWKVEMRIQTRHRDIVMSYSQEF